MRKLAIAVALILVLPMAAAALVGPEPGSPDFNLVFKELDGGPVYDTLAFDTAAMPSGYKWDFGDREGYRCAFVELIHEASGRVVFRVEVEQNRDYEEENPPGFQINDKGGVEHGDGTNPPFPSDADPCGTDEGGSEPSPAHNRWVPNGEDHFPHYGHHDTSPAIELFVDGVRVAVLDLARDDCARGYWTPGNEPGEGVLWWDEDFPENNGHHPLACNGGGGEPFAAARFFVINYGSDTGYCIGDSLLGPQCQGMIEPPPPPTTPPPTPCGKRGCDSTPPPKG